MDGRWYLSLTMSDLVRDNKPLPIVYAQSPYGGLDESGFWNALGKPAITSLVSPVAVTVDDLKMHFDPKFVDRVTGKKRAGSLDLMPQDLTRPLDATFVELSMKALGGTLRAVEIAERHGMGINTSGGFHLADRRGGQPRNAFNDVIYALDEALSRDPNQRIAVIDTDSDIAVGTQKTLADYDRRASLYDMYSAIHRAKVPTPTDTYHPFEVSERTSDQGFLTVVNAMIKQVKQDAEKQPFNMVIFIGGYDWLKNEHAGTDVLATSLLERDKMIQELSLLLHCDKRNAPPPFVWLRGGGDSPLSSVTHGTSVRYGIERMRHARDTGILPASV